MSQLASGFDYLHEQKVAFSDVDPALFTHSTGI